LRTELRYEACVQISCKISNAILSYYEKQGLDLSSHFENFSAPIEILSDPNCWLKADEMENFLKQVGPIVERHSAKDWLQNVGHATPELYAWGVLDSVLKMMPKPQEMWSLPERFLGYFISPQPPVAEIKRTEMTLQFDLPVTSEQYPLITSYLRFAFESLPSYIGREQASVVWDGFHLRMDWSTLQNSIFDEQPDPGYHISPDLLRSVVTDLEKTHRDLEIQNSRLEQRNSELLRAQSELEKQLQNKILISEKVLHVKTETKINSEVKDMSSEELRHELGRLNDYMTRAQQVIQIMASMDGASSRQKIPVSELLRRVDWSQIPSQFSQTMKRCFEIIDTSKNTPEDIPRSSTCQKSSVSTPVKSSTVEAIQQ
jgi:hypothetical protein